MQSRTYVRRLSSCRRTSDPRATPVDDLTNFFFFYTMDYVQCRVTSLAIVFKFTVPRSGISNLYRRKIYEIFVMVPLANEHRIIIGRGSMYFLAITSQLGNPRLKKYNDSRFRANMARVHVSSGLCSCGFRIEIRKTGRPPVFTTDFHFGKFLGLGKNL